MQVSIRKTNYGPAIMFMVFFGCGAGYLSLWIMDTFNLGLEVTGITKYALVYYSACMVISAGILVISKAARTVAFYYALYPFGLFMIFTTGFTSTLAPNPLADQFAAMQVFMVQASVWLIPALVTGYFIVAAWRRDTYAVAGE